MKKLLAIVIIALLTSCTAYKPAVPAQSDADRAAQIFPGATLADLNQGKTIFESHCNKCHSLKRPFKRSEDEIRKALPRMSKKAKLDSSQQELVLKYLLTMHNVQQAQ